MKTGIEILNSAIAYISTIEMEDAAQQDALTILNIAIETLFAEPASIPTKTIEQIHSAFANGEPTTEAEQIRALGRTIAQGDAEYARLSVQDFFSDESGSIPLDPRFIFGALVIVPALFVALKETVRILFGKRTTRRPIL